MFGKGNTAFWIIFSIIHIIATLLLSIQLYYMGRWKLGEGLPAQGGVDDAVNPGDGGICTHRRVWGVSE